MDLYFVTLTHLSNQFKSLATVFSIGPIRIIYCFMA